jgi:hypothetical protein
MSCSMAAELRLIVAPGATYAALARQPSRIGPLGALRRPLFVAAVLGASIALPATGRITPALFLSTALGWSVVVALQIAIALSLIAVPSRRTVGWPRALDLFFASHAPWSLWFLAAAAWGLSPFADWSRPLLLLALAPIVLTPRMIAAFFREVLELDPRHAIGRTVAHQAITWTVFLLLAGSAVALWPRIVGWIE